MPNTVNGFYQKAATAAVGILATITLAWTANISTTQTTHATTLAERGVILANAGIAATENTREIKAVKRKVEKIDRKVDRIQLLQEIDLRSRGIDVPPANPVPDDDE